MTHKELRANGFRLSQLQLQSRGYHHCGVYVYLLYGLGERYFGSIKRTGYRGRRGRWGAYPPLKSGGFDRKKPISEHRTVPEAAAALIRFAKLPTPMRRPPVTCPRCGSTSRVLYTMGGVQQRECRLGHRFTHDKWMADRVIWAPAAIGSLSKEGDLI